MNKRRAWIGLAVAALSVAALALWLWPNPAPLSPPTPGTALLAAAQGLDEITIDAAFDPLAHTLTVQQTLTLVNRTGVAQRQPVLRTYANAFASEDFSPAAIDELYDACYPGGFSAGGLHFTLVGLADAQGTTQGLSYSFGDDAHTVLRLTLPADWAPGETLSLRLGYTLTVPQAAYRFGTQESLWALGNAFVIPAPFEDGAYRTDAYAPIGDPFVSECRNYTVRVTASQGYTVVGSAAAETAPAADGLRVTRFSALAVRDFALCLSTAYQRAQRLEQGVLVEACAASAADAQLLCRYGAQALACYTARYGAYPYPTLTLAQVALPLQAMTYPSLAMIGTQALAGGGEALEQLVARQVALQWWSAVVGSDGFNQPWQDEALAEFALLDYWETTRSQAARADLQFSRVEAAMRVTIPRGVTPGSPVDYFGDLSEYRVVVYGRGAAALCALDTALSGGLDAFLARYYAACAFTQPTRADFERLLATVTGEDWAPLLSDYLDTTW